jgi:adenylosuccinate synthase
VAVAYTVRLGGVNEIAMMALDTLAGLKELNICKAYRINGRQTTFFPGTAEDLAAANASTKPCPMG